MDIELFKSFGFKGFLEEERSASKLAKLTSLTEREVFKYIDVLRAQGLIEERFIEPDGESPEPGTYGWRFKLREAPLTPAISRERLLKVADDFQSLIGEMPLRSKGEKEFHLYILRSSAHRAMVQGLDILTALEFFQS